MLSVKALKNEKSITMLREALTDLKGVDIPDARCDRKQKIFVKLYKKDLLDQWPML